MSNVNFEITKTAYNRYAAVDMYTGEVIAVMTKSAGLWGVNVDYSLTDQMGTEFFRHATPAKKYFQKCVEAYLEETKWGDVCSLGDAPTGDEVPSIRVVGECTSGSLYGENTTIQFTNVSGHVVGRVEIINWEEVVALEVLPKFAGQGYDRAIIKWLQGLYDSLVVSSVVEEGERWVPNSETIGGWK